MRTREPISDTEYAECQKCVRKWAFKKMMKLEKKLKRYAKIYFGQDMLIICKNPEAFKEAIKSGKVSVEINEKARPL